MVKSNYIPVRFSDEELAQIKFIGEEAEVANTSEAVRYAVAYTVHGLKKGQTMPEETVVILPEKV